MSSSAGSLQAEHPGRFDVWGLVAASFVALAWGLTSPFFHFATLGSEERTMLDVFALALVVVGIRIGDLVDANVRVGLLLFAGSVVLSAYLSWRLRRLYR